MLTRTEIERLAQAAHSLRPDWPIRSLCTWLGADHASRPYQDVAVALAYIATDPATHTPKRMNETGPWWQATVRAGTGQSGQMLPRPDDPRCDQPGHEHELARNCRACRSEALAAPDRPGHSITLTPEQASTNARWAQQIRSLDHAQLASGERDDTEDGA